MSPSIGLSPPSYLQNRTTRHVDFMRDAYAGTSRHDTARTVDRPAAMNYETVPCPKPPVAVESPCSAQISGSPLAVDNLAHLAHHLFYGRVPTQTRLELHSHTSSSGKLSPLRAIWVYLRMSGNRPPPPSIRHRPLSGATLQTH